MLVKEQDKAASQMERDGDLRMLGKDIAGFEEFVCEKVKAQLLEVPVEARHVADLAQGVDMDKKVRLGRHW